MQSKLKATQTMQVQNNVSPTRFTEHAPTQRHTTRCPAGITVFHTPSCLTCGSWFKKGSVSRPRQGTGQAPVDRIHSSVPQFESVHGLLDRQSISLVRQQRQWNLSQNTTVYFHSANYRETYKYIPSLQDRKIRNCNEERDSHQHGTLFFFLGDSRC